MSNRQTASNGINNTTSQNNTVIEESNLLETSPAGPSSRAASGAETGAGTGVGHGIGSSNSSGSIGGASYHTNTLDLKRQLSNATIDDVVQNNSSSPLARVTTPLTGSSTDNRPKSTSPHNHQTRLTKALLLYLSVFRVVQPLASLGAFGTITPTSKARIGGDMIICMIFCGLWFLSLVGLVIDALWVDCGKLTGLETVFLDNRHSIDKIKTVCQLEKATLGLSFISWACWMGVLVVLLYGHFWKRRQVIASRLRERLSRRRPSQAAAAGVSSAISPDAGVGQSGSSISGRSPVAVAGSAQQHPQQPSDCGCQDMEGEVGLTGVICQYDDDQSSMNPTIRRTEHSENVA
ncbi:hypothetical protein BGX27_001197 [Mortierella sp. AM989]|nr:hypothetical protein BGX27_001197 [Mortierella sp. AM989]